MNNNELMRENQLKAGLMGVKRQVESLLSDKAKSDRFMAAALVVAKDKSLSGCSPESISQALVGVAMSDLNVDRNIGHCYLIKYGADVQLQIGYKGYIQLLFRAGWLVKAFPVYKCDNFRMHFDGWDNRVEFGPELDLRDESNKDWVVDNLRGVFVVARHGESKEDYSAFISQATVERLRKVSPNQKNSARPTGIWFDWYTEMSIAKAIKKVAKQLPIGDPRVAMSIAADDMAEIGAKVDYIQTQETGVVIFEEAQPPNQRAQGVSIDDILGVAQDVPTETQKTAFQDWQQMLADAQSDEEFCEIVASMPDGAVSAAIAKTTTKGQLNRIYLALPKTRQEGFLELRVMHDE